MIFFPYMGEAFPLPPSPSDMRTDIYERDSASRREHTDQIYARLAVLDEEKAVDPEVDQVGERALLEATLDELQRKQGIADAAYENGR